MKNRGNSYIMDEVNCACGPKFAGCGKGVVISMNSSMKKINRLVAGALLTGAMLGIVSCSSKAEGVSESLLTIAKDGSIREEIMENFEKGYYDKDELQRKILEQAASYNRNAGTECVRVEKVEAKEDKILVKMTYTGSEDYASFNQAVFFTGTAREAEESGYNLDVVLSGIKNDQETIGKSDLLALEGSRVLITNISEGIALTGKALYVSDNVVPASNAKTVWYTGGEEGLAYIVYK